MDRVAAMRAFVRVVEAGSFTKAADTLELPNATVTRAVQRLESDLKVRLLNRTTRSVTVTPEGAAYYERIVRLLAELADIEASTRQSHARPSGRVRVETAAAIAAHVLIPALPEFHRAYPDLHIDLRVGSKHADLVAEGIDCSIRPGEVHEQLMVARRIGDFDFTTCATPGFIAMHGTPRTPQDLTRMPTLGMVVASDPARAWPFAFSDAAAESAWSLDHRMVINDANAYVAAALAGLGIIQAPAYAVRSAIVSGALVPLLEDFRTPAAPLHVLYAPNRYLSAKVRVFIDWVADLFERNDSVRRKA